MKRCNQAIILKIHNFLELCINIRQFTIFYLINERKKKNVRHQVRVIFYLKKKQQLDSETS